jgi:hypothetical protein
VGGAMRKQAEISCSSDGGGPWPGEVSPSSSTQVTK